MKTEIIKLDKDNLDMDKLRHAADILKNGGLVAFPTETVYGLGANALDINAVNGIFKAKGRPSDNPLIVHIADREDLQKLVSEIPKDTYQLMDQFWPGPLTIVLKKSSLVPTVITAGLDTVAVRMPSHPVALELIRMAGVPVAAPSANTSGKPSPTEARHVIEDLEGKVDAIIDAGSAKVGLESTVLDMSVVPPMILRPGGVTPQQLNTVLKGVMVDPAIMGTKEKNVVPKSPGMKYTHYSPEAEVIIVQGSVSNIVEKISQLAAENSEKNIKVGVMATEQTKDQYAPHFVISVGDRNMPETIAANLFGTLRKFDEAGVQLILAEAVENTEIGLAIMNRMRKAAGNKIVEV
ncbi:MAG: L-threonylcarbamoyladenylate synthase [Clostridia bacterium]|nr:L-threonylcarbamoyladenylate synthase [Clostridia bacterium]